MIHFFIPLTYPNFSRLLHFPLTVGMLELYHLIKFSYNAPSFAEL